MKNRVLLLVAFFIMSASALRTAAQDVVLSVGYITAEPAAFNSGWNIGLLGRYDFTNKFSQDLGVTYGFANYNETFLPSTGNAGTYKAHTDLISIRTHSDFNMINSEKTRFYTGIGPCVNFFSTNSDIIDGAVNAGLGIVVGYETHSFMKTPWGFFTRARFEYDPQLSEQEYGHYSPFKEQMSIFEVNVGVSYSFKNKAQ